MIKEKCRPISLMITDIKILKKILTNRIHQYLKTVTYHDLGGLFWRRAWQPTPVFLPGESPWTEEPGGLQSMGSQRVGHNWATKQSTGGLLQGWMQGWRIWKSCNVIHYIKRLKKKIRGSYQLTQKSIGQNSRGTHEKNLRKAGIKQNFLPQKT